MQLFGNRGGCRRWPGARPTNGGCLTTYCRLPARGRARAVLLAAFIAVGTRAVVPCRGAGPAGHPRAGAKKKVVVWDFRKMAGPAQIGAKRRVGHFRACAKINVTLRHFLIWISRRWCSSILGAFRGVQDARFSFVDC